MIRSSLKKLYHRYMDGTPVPTFAGSGRDEGSKDSEWAADDLFSEEEYARGGAPSETLRDLSQEMHRNESVEEYHGRLERGQKYLRQLSAEKKKGRPCTSSFSHKYECQVGMDGGSGRPFPQKKRSKEDYSHAALIKWLCVAEFMGGRTRRVLSDAELVKHIMIFMSEIPGEYRKGGIYEEWERQLAKKLKWADPPLAQLPTSLTRQSKLLPTPPNQMGCIYTKEGHVTKKPVGRLGVKETSLRDKEHGVMQDILVHMEGQLSAYPFPISKVCRAECRETIVFDTSQIATLKQQLMNISDNELTAAVKTLEKRTMGPGDNCAKCGAGVLSCRGKDMCDFLHVSHPKKSESASEYHIYAVANGVWPRSCIQFDSFINQFGKEVTVKVTRARWANYQIALLLHNQSPRAASSRASQDEEAATRAKQQQQQRQQQQQHHHQDVDCGGGDYSKGRVRGGSSDGGYGFVPSPSPAFRPPPYFSLNSKRTRAASMTKVGEVGASAKGVQLQLQQQQQHQQLVQQCGVEPCAELGEVATAPTALPHIEQWGQQHQAQLAQQQEQVVQQRDAGLCGDGGGDDRDGGGGIGGGDNGCGDGGAGGCGDFPASPSVLPLVPSLSPPPQRACTAPAAKAREAAVNTVAASAARMEAVQGVILRREKLDQQQMQIYITSTDGGHIALDVEDTETIDSVKRKIECILGIKPKEQRLTCGGKDLMEGWRTLRKYNVGNESTLHLSLMILGGSSATGRGQASAAVYKPGDRVVLLMASGATLGGTVEDVSATGGNNTYHVLVDGETEAREDVPGHKLREATPQRSIEVFEPFDRVRVVLPNGASHHGSVEARTAAGTYSVRMDTGERQEGVPGNALSRVGPTQQVRTVQEPVYKEERGEGGGKSNPTTRAEAKSEGHISAHDQRLFAAGAASATNQRRRSREEDEEDGEGQIPERRRRSSEQVHTAQQHGADLSDIEIVTQHLDIEEHFRGHNRLERENNLQGAQGDNEVHPPPPARVAPPPYQPRAGATPLQDAANRIAERRFMQDTMGSDPPIRPQAAQRTPVPPSQARPSDPTPPAFGSPLERLMDLLNGPREERGSGGGDQSAVAGLLEELLAGGGGRGRGRWGRRGRRRGREERERETTVVRRAQRSRRVLRGADVERGPLAVQQRCGGDEPAL